MRTAHWKDRLLPLLLFLLYSIVDCLATNCIFDEHMAKFGPPNIPKAAPQKTNYDWEPIRIVASTKDLLEPSKYCIKNKELIDECGKDDENSSSLFATVKVEQKRILMGILAKAIVLHTDRLLVQRVVGPLVIPDFSMNECCKYFNVPKEHHTVGVENTDMVLYIANVEAMGNGMGAVSLGVTCAKSSDGRPIAGSIIFGPGHSEVNRHTVRLVAHQIAHAIGFVYAEMKSRNMIINKNVRSKIFPVSVVKSDKTKKMAQAHYGCPTAEGMELEDGRTNNKKLSHWERRNAKDELMAYPVMGGDTAFIGFYTNITLAFFEDMGFYKANFQMAEHMEYGHKAGCDFLTGKCMENGVTKWPKMFCDFPVSSEKAYACTTDRFGMGGCAVTEDYMQSLPIQFRYFESPIKGGLEYVLTDYCPVVEQLYPHGCTNPSIKGNMHGSLFSKNSICLDGSALIVNTDGKSVPVGAVCAEISCEGGSVRVKYHGDTNRWHDCPEGKSLTPSSTSDSFVSGTIKCPKYKEVCTVAPDGSSLVPRVTYAPIEPLTEVSSGSQSGEKSNDGSSVPFGLIPSVCFFALFFTEYIIA